MEIGRCPVPRVNNDIGLIDRRPNSIRESLGARRYVSVGQDQQVHVNTLAHPPMVSGGAAGHLVGLRTPAKAGLARDSAVSQRDLREVVAADETHGGTSGLRGVGRLFVLTKRPEACG